MKKHILDRIDPKLLGTRLQEARKSSGLTQQDVADQLGVARTTLVAIEKGERRLEPGELIKLTSIYGRAVSEFLREPVVVESFVPQFRAAWREDFTGNENIQKIADELQRLADDYARLERMCGMPLPRNYPPVYETHGSAPEFVAEEIAAAERNRLGVGDGPLSNLRERLEADAGLRIFYFPMPGTISGLFAYNDTLGGCMAINSHHPKDRRRWSLSHEYGHFLMHRYQAEITFMTAKWQAAQKERLADNFAKHFLMPTSGLSRRFSELQRAHEGGISLASICSLADHYQVSIQAMILRLEELKRLSSGTWARLEAEGFKVRQAQELLGIDTAPGPPEMLPKRYQRLAIIAFMKGSLSEGQLAGLLRTDRVSARSLVHEVSRPFAAENTGDLEQIASNLGSLLTAR